MKRPFPIALWPAPPLAPRVAPYTAAVTSSFDRVVDEYLQDAWEENPVFATAAGIEGYDDRLPDLTLEGFERRAQREDAWLARVEANSDDQLTPDERIDRDLMRSTL